MVVKVGKFRDVRIRFEDLMTDVIFIFVGIAMMLAAPNPNFENMFGWGVLLMAIGVFLVGLDVVLYLIRKRKMKK